MFDYTDQPHPARVTFSFRTLLKVSLRIFIIYYLLRTSQGASGSGRLKRCLTALTDFLGPLVSTLYTLPCLPYGVRYGVKTLTGSGTPWHTLHQVQLYLEVVPSWTAGRSQLWAHCNL